MTDVRLLCTDLDGTLLDSAGDVSPATRGALRDAARAGLTVLAVTGRPVRDALEVARAHGLTGPLACSNGAVIVRAETGGVLHREGFAPAVARGLLGRLRAAVPGVVLGVDTARGLHLDAPFRHLVPDCWPHRPEADVATAVRDGDTVVKILAVHPAVGPQALGRLFEPLAAGAFRMTRSTSYFLELSRAETDKGRALHRLAGLVGVPAGRTAAVGDMPNDLPMLAAARLGAAVANAHEDVLRQADVVLPANDDDGVAELIRMLV
ncbi:HAD family hydrolase [Streptomyces sp. TRM 70351]|uniref:HAD family hydrolase n=1 Tax=Streptomyces sp. TRM 70351 TaxID=3116552 RepID=UPI002E7BB7EB|nr:HAD family hydrolase [Streptomyces sp. TRM 70351]MEE1930147.1 HAD family hydrolase [Streptomyces sp. TRM 70351]